MARKEDGRVFDPIRCSLPYVAPIPAIEDIDDCFVPDVPSPIFDGPLVREPVSVPSLIYCPTEQSVIELISQYGGCNCARWQAYLDEDFTITATSPSTERILNLTEQYTTPGGWFDSDVAATGYDVRILQDGVYEFSMTLIGISDSTSPGSDYYWAKGYAWFESKLPSDAVVDVPTGEIAMKMIESSSGEDWGTWHRSTQVDVLEDTLFRIMGQLTGDVSGSDDIILRGDSDETSRHPCSWSIKYIRPLDDESS